MLAGRDKARCLATLAVVVSSGMLLLPVRPTLAPAARVHLSHFVTPVQLVPVHLKRLLLLILEKRKFGLKKILFMSLNLMLLQ